MEITRSVNDGIVELVVVGRLDGYWADHLDAALTDAKNPYFDNVPIGQIFADRAKAVNVSPYKGIKYAAIMQAVQDGLTRVESKKQSIEASWAQVVTDIKALS